MACLSAAFQSCAPSKAKSHALPHGFSVIAVLHAFHARLTIGSGFCGR
jgi:hypothetical protein